MSAGIIGGGVLQAFAAIKEGQIAKAQGAFAEKISIRNQQALERQAKAEVEAAGVEETRIARQEKIVKAKQRAAIGKGVGLAGATLSFLTDTAYQFSMERNLALRRGMVRGRELRQKGRIIRAQGKWAATMGIQARRLSYVKAGASILGSVGMAKALQPGAGIVGTPPAMGTTPAFTTGQRFSTFSGGGLVLPP